MTPTREAPPQTAVVARASRGGADTLPSTPSQEEQKFLDKAKKQFHQAADAEREIRQEALEDLRFYAGEQWPDHIRGDRNITNRPCLTINRLPQFGAQIINEQRQSRPAIQINPVGDGADVDTAEVIQGMMRHIEVNSHAEIAYDTAFEHAVIHGFGYFRLLTDYIDDNSFDQEVIIEPIDDPFSVYYDPSCKKRANIDAEYAFIVQDIPRLQYRDAYPKSQMAGLSDFRSTGDGERDWYTMDGIRVAEYYWVEKTKRVLVRLLNGRTIPEDELPEDAAIEIRGGRPVMRKAEIRRVYWCKMNAREVLASKRVPGKSIPIVPVYGSKLIVNGRKKLVGIVRYAKDAQRMYNYTRSGITEQLALSSKAPWIMAEGQDENHEQEWRYANTRNFGVLHYKPKTVGDQIVGPPIRNVFEPPIHGLTVALSQSDNDLKATTGIYDPSLGERSGAQSGVAISALQRQGERANAHLLDNMTRAVERCGEIALEMIPEVYDVPRIVRIVNPDQTHRMVQINEHFEEDGAPKLYDVTLGRYDVTVNVGQNFSTKRQEFVQAVLSLVQAAPQTMAVVMDLLVRNMDWPGAQEIADRLKKMLPPQLQDSEDGEGAAVPPEVQGQIQQLMQQNAQLVQALQSATSAIDQKRLEYESRERIAAMQSQVALIVAELKANSADAQTMAKLEYDAIAQRLDLLHKGMTLEQDAASRAEEAKLKAKATKTEPKNPQGKKAA